jgi:hypothetical protein
MTRKATHGHVIVADPLSLASLLAIGWGAGPVLAVQLDPRPAPGPRNPLAHRAHCRGRDAKRGRTNGLPWDGTSPVSAPTEIDSKKPSPRTDLGLGLWQAKMGLKK